MRRPLASTDEILRFVFSIAEDPLLISLDDNVKASIDELFGNCWTKCRTPFVFFFLATQPQHRHIEWGEGISYRQAESGSVTRTEKQKRHRYRITYMLLLGQVAVVEIGLYH